MLLRLTTLLLASSCVLFGAYTASRVAGPPSGFEPGGGLPKGVALNNNGVALFNSVHLIYFVPTGYYGNSQPFLATAINSPSPFATPLPLNNEFCCTTGYALNDAGQVAGEGYGSFYSNAFVATTAGTTTVPTPGWNSSYATAINNSGAIAGRGYYAGNDTPFVGSATGITVLARKPAWGFVSMLALSDSGVAIGAAYLGPGIFELFTADTTGILSTQVMTGTDSTWSDIFPSVANKSGTLAGGGTVGGAYVAWVLTAGGAVQRLPTGDGWYSLSVTDINENGEILGQGVRNGENVFWTYSAARVFWS